MNLYYSGDYINIDLSKLSEGGCFIQNDELNSTLDILNLTLGKSNWAINEMTQVDYPYF